MKLDTPLSLFIFHVLEQPAFQIGLEIDEIAELFCAEQKKEFSDSAYKSISRRLLQMYKEKILARFTPPSSNKWCYYLNPKSLGVIRRWADNHELKPRPKAVNTIFHLRLGASSLVKIIASGLRSDEIDSYAIIEGFNVEISDNQIETKCLRPDAFVKMGECTFSVEIDANTEDKTQLRDKLAKYILFLNKKDNREIRVLFIATHFQRTKMIFSLLQEILQKLPANSTEQIANRIYFSCLEFLENGFIHGWVSANTKKDITKSDFVSGIAN